MHDNSLPPFSILSSMRVLVLEDNEMERRLLAAMLSRLGVGHVAQADGGAAAMALIDAAPPFDVVLCDLQMQDRTQMDGIEFLRLAAHRLRCPLVVLSGIDEDLAIAAETLAAASGATWIGRLRKPIILSELHVLLASCAGTGAREPGTAAPRRALPRIWSAADLRTALAKRELTAWFQPQHCLATGRLFGVEALARWEHPDAGLVMPGDFVPLMERDGMVDALFDAILDRALDAVTAWAARGHRVPVSINASPLTLENVDVPNLWRERVEARGIDPGQITIEVTETAVARNFHGLLESVTRLRMHGFRVALDDFGTSYSSLQQMSELPATEIKIDRSFVDRALRYPRARVIIESIAELGRKLGMVIVAEGVETHVQSDFVRAIGCDAAQGWFHGRPMRAEALPLASAAQTTSVHTMT